MGGGPHEKGSRHVEFLKRIHHTQQSHSRSKRDRSPHETHHRRGFTLSYLSAVVRQIFGRSQRQSHLGPSQEANTATPGGTRAGAPFTRTSPVGEAMEWEGLRGDQSCRGPTDIRDAQATRTSNERQSASNP